MFNSLWNVSGSSSEGMCPGLEEKMKALQVLSLALLAVLEASGQVLVAGKCPQPAVVRFFDASRVNIPTSHCYKQTLTSAEALVSGMSSFGSMMIVDDRFCFLIADKVDPDRNTQFNDFMWH